MGANNQIYAHTGPTPAEPGKFVEYLQGFKVPGGIKLVIRDRDDNSSSIILPIGEEVCLAASILACRMAYNSGQ